ncbi:hypothetical protein [Sporomusa malonica]|uniref:Uncharacterized protein n=1 Tax=Sporomusa malonica TaxID=112901 RepID=A0A1W2EHZ8_9FIRM|nr:hypothetical protein [Sporomusa malonica]SMD09327.1 hypothetical protein SAMN04488500_12470 [Sporomusa malonica]
MPKTVLLAHYNQKLANELTAHGFRVVDSTAHSKPGQAADACLFASYHPDTDACFTDYPDHADISIGNYHYTTSDHPTTTMLNITGLNASQIADTLRHKLARQPRL